MKCKFCMEEMEMYLNKNYKTGISIVFLSISLAGCCGPCFAPCNPFHKNKVADINKKVINKLTFMTYLNENTN